MDAVIRHGTSRDFAGLEIFLPPFLSEAGKRERFLRALHDGEVLIVDDGGPIAFAWIQPHGFFGHAFVNALAVRPEQRRRAHASRLLTRSESYATSDRVFTSTNTSNAPMHAVLAKNAWHRCGWIDALDPGDPEIVYVKLQSPP
jgi:GNAT superfamily N-acetyltransferase